jgi:hypothetical protein
MKLRNLLLTMGIVLFCFVVACTKNQNPVTPPNKQDSTKTNPDSIAAPVDSSKIVNLKKGLLLYLPFSGNIADSSGNGNPTQAIGGSVLTSDEHGYANQAFGGTGNGERIKVTNNGTIKFDTSYSLSYDFMILAPARQAIVTMINTTTGNGPSFLTSTSISGLSNLAFYANDISSGCDEAGPSAGGSSAVGDTSIVPNPGSWYNVVNVYHKGTVQTYVNGILTGTSKGTGTAALLCPDAQVVVGGWWDGDPISINGKVDEVRLYNRVLNPAEIAYLSRNFQPITTKAKAQPIHN